MKFPLAFMHIPKSAGTALANAIVQLPPYQHEAHGWDRCLYGAYDEYETWDQGRRPWLFLSHKEIPKGKNFLFGHIAFSNIKKSYNNAHVFTIIRNPFSRILSLWTFWRSKPDGLESDIGTYAENVYLSRRSLESFLRNTSIAAQTDNVVARMLLWPHSLVPDDDFIDDRHLAEIVSLSLSRLNEFGFVDIYENRNLIKNFQDWLGHSLDVKLYNETCPVPNQYRSTMQLELTPECCRLMRERTLVDQAIWESVAERQLGIDSIISLNSLSVKSSISRANKILSGGPS